MPNTKQMAVDIRCVGSSSFGIGGTNAHVLLTAPETTSGPGCISGAVLATSHSTSGAESIFGTGASTQPQSASSGWDLHAISGIGSISDVCAVSSAPAVACATPTGIMMPSSGAPSGIGLPLAPSMPILGVAGDVVEGYGGKATKYRKGPPPIVSAPSKGFDSDTNSESDPRMESDGLTNRVPNSDLRTVSDPNHSTDPEPAPVVASVCASPFTSLLYDVVWEPAFLAETRVRMLPVVMLDGRYYHNVLYINYTTAYHSIRHTDGARPQCIVA